VFTEVMTVREAAPDHFKDVSKGEIVSVEQRFVTLPDMKKIR
jgi:hypothetical protein